MSDPRAPRPVQPRAPAPAASAVRPASAKVPSRPPPPPLPAATGVTPPLPPVTPIRAKQPSTTAVDDEWTAIDVAAPARAAAAQAAPEGLSAGAKNEIQAAVRAAVQDALAPLARAAVQDALAPLTRAIGELSAALERDRRERAQRDESLAKDMNALATRAATPSLIPISAPPPPLGARGMSTPAPPLVSASPLDVTPRVPAAAMRAPIEALRSRPDLAHFEAAPSVGALPEFLDGERRRRRAAWTASVVLLALVGGLAALAILSHSQ